MSTIVTLESGAIFAEDFRIVRPLSAGGMGAVYIADQISTGRQRALKLMLPQLVTDPKSRDRFRQEATIGSRIASEHVVEVVSAGVDAATGAPWLAMELLRGEDLASLVRRSGVVHPAAALEIVQQMCHAVGAAHAAGIVHRDLKPENVFVAEAKRSGVKCTVKILDFGIAKVVADARVTDTAAIGSPMWMAPEQSARGGFIGPQTDVWAMGLIVFHMLTGRYFWRAGEDANATVAQLLREIVLEPIPRASERARELGKVALLPPGFDTWLARSLDRLANARFTNASEQLDALVAIFTPSFLGLAPASHAPPSSFDATADATALETPPPPAGAAARTTSAVAASVSTPPVHPQRRAPRGVLALVGAVLIAGAAAVAWVALGRPGAREAAQPVEAADVRVERALDALTSGATQRKSAAFCMQAYADYKAAYPEARRIDSGADTKDAVKFGPAQARTFAPMCLAKAGACTQGFAVLKEAWNADPTVRHDFDDTVLRANFDAITNSACAGRE